MRKSIGIVCCVILMLVMIRLGIFFNTFGTLGSYFVYPFLVAQHKIVTPIKHYFEKKREREELEVVIKKLHAVRDELMAENVSLRALLSFEKETKEIRDFKEHYYDKDAKLAHVLIKHFSDQSHYFLLDRGSNDGIAQDMVAVYKNCLVGKVVEVYPYYSKVLLITDSLCKVAAYCAHTKICGIHEGKNQEDATILNYVSHLQDIEEDDVIISSGEGLIFPKGFGLGKIKSCKVNGLLYDVELEPLIDIHALDYCYIIQKGKRNAELHCDISDFFQKQQDDISVAANDTPSINRYEHVTPLDQIPVEQEKSEVA